MAWKERELEDWLENEQNFNDLLFDVPSKWFGCYELLGRQVQCATGRIDLLYMFNPAIAESKSLIPPRLAIVELKARRVTGSDVAQAIKYKESIRHACIDFEVSNWSRHEKHIPIEIEIFLIGTSINKNASDAIGFELSKRFIMVGKTKNGFVRISRDNEVGTSYDSFKGQHIPQLNSFFNACTARNDRCKGERQKKEIEAALHTKHERFKYSRN